MDKLLYLALGLTVLAVIYLAAIGIWQISVVAPQCARLGYASSLVMPNGDAYCVKFVGGTQVVVPFTTKE
jgi:hypothetical protein